MPIAETLRLGSADRRRAQFGGDPDPLFGFAGEPRILQRKESRWWMDPTNR